MSRLFPTSGHNASSTRNCSFVSPLNSFAQALACTSAYPPSPSPSAVGKLGRPSMAGGATQAPLHPLLLAAPAARLTTPVVAPAMAPGTDWPESGRRVLRGSAAFCCAGAAIAAVRGVAPAPAARVTLLAGAVAAPFLALREIVVHVARAEGPVASAVVGGLAGYLGALYAVGPSWVAVSRGAVVVGAGCGLVDALVSGLDWRRKVYVVRTEERAQAAAAAAAAAADDASVTQRQPLPWWARWPVWFPVLKEIDYEYEELIRRRADTLAALEAEQSRIAALLKALEVVKARKVAAAAAAAADAGSASATEGQADSDRLLGSPVVEGTKHDPIISQDVNIRIRSKSGSPPSASQRRALAAGIPRTLSDVTDSDPASPPSSP